METNELLYTLNACVPSVCVCLNLLEQNPRNPALSCSRSRRTKLNFLLLDLEETDSSRDEGFRRKSKKVLNLSKLLVYRIEKR